MSSTERVVLIINTDCVLCEVKTKVSRIISTDIRAGIKRTTNMSSNYRYEPHNDVSVNDGPHIRRWSNTIIFFFSCGAATQCGSWPPHSWGFSITHNDAPQSVGLLWTSDQLVAETCTWQRTTLTTDKYPCPRWDSNPRSQQASGRRPTP